MNAKKLFASLLAAAAAGLVALIVFNLMGHKNSEPAKPVVETAEVLVAASRIEPGKLLGASDVRWQEWPRKNIDPSFISKNGTGDVTAIVGGFAARAPMVQGEPLTFAKIAKAQGGGYLAATLGDGMRAVAIPVKVEGIAGGFVQPNNRVDVIAIRAGQSYGAHIGSQVIVTDVRVLAVDQSFDGQAQKIVNDVRTVTLELSPAQVNVVAQARGSNDFILSLRGLGDDRTAKADDHQDKIVSGDVQVIRYGKLRRPAGDGGNQ